MSKYVDNVPTTSVSCFSVFWLSLSYTHSLLLFSFYFSFFLTVVLCRIILHCKYSQVEDVHVETIDKYLFANPALQTVQHLVVTSEHIDGLLDMNQITRAWGVKLSTGNVLGLTGMLFNDFLEHEVIDIDGETYKEVSSQACSVAHQNLLTILLNPLSSCLLLVVYDVVNGSDSLSC
jgi:hypothetical protein